MCNANASSIVYCMYSSFPQSKATALFSPEIGGSNGIEPLVLAGQLDLPVVDADGMGRAFPELQMYTPAIYGLDPTPAVLVDERVIENKHFK